MAASRDVVGSSSMDPHKSLEAIKSLIDPVLQSVGGSTISSSTTTTTTTRTLSSSSLSPTSHLRLGPTIKPRGLGSDLTPSSSTSQQPSAHPSSSSTPSSSKQQQLTDQQQSQIDTSIQLLFRAIVHWTKLVRSPSQTPLGGAGGDGEERFRLGSPPPSADGGIGGEEEEDILEIGRKGRRKGKGVGWDSPMVGPVGPVGSEDKKEKVDGQGIESSGSGKAVGNIGKVEDGPETPMSLGGFTEMGIGKMRWRSDAMVIYSFLNILIQLHLHNLLLNPYHTSSTHPTTTTTASEDTRRDRQNGISSWRQGLESKLRVLMEEVGNCLRGIVQTPGSSGGHEGAKICVIYLTAVLTPDQNEARRNWKALASHKPSGIEEADGLRGIAKERLMFLESKPTSTSCIPFPGSANGGSDSPPSKPPQRPYVLSRASSILSLASVFSTRSRAFSSELQCKSTSSLPTLSLEVVEQRSMRLREDGLPANGERDEGRSRSASDSAEEVLRRYGGNQPPPKRRRQNERGWLSGLKAMKKLSGLHHSFTPIADEEEARESESKDGSNTPKVAGTISNGSMESSVEAQLIPGKKRSSAREDIATPLVGSVGKLSSTLKPRTPLSITPRANGATITRTQSSPWLESLASDSTIKAAMSTAERKSSIISDPDLLPVRPRLQTVRSSPQLRPAPRAFENDTALPPLDPAFLAAEANSSFTHENECAVCEAIGVNFPRCAKCGDTFCSRECRVGNDAGGDGKRHICGIWKARKLLEPPKPKPRSRRSSVAPNPSPSLTVRVVS